MPRTLVEYQDVASEEIRRWNVANKRSYFETCERFPEELCALKVVICRADGEKEDIVGYAIWGWTPGVSIPFCLDPFCFAWGQGGEVKTGREGLS